MISAINYGDIILAHLNPTRGAEISKTRPCVVISRNAINHGTPFVIVVPLTGNTVKILPFQLYLAASPQNGLSQDSKTLPEQMKSIDKTRCVKKLGELESHHMQELEKNVLFILNQTKDF